MKLRTVGEIKAKIVELENDHSKFSEFLSDIYKDNDCKKKIKKHTWRIRKQIDILNWVLDDELPF